MPSSAAISAWLYPSISLSTSTLRRAPGSAFTAACSSICFRRESCGSRHLCRAVERYLTAPFAAALAHQRDTHGDTPQPGTEPASFLIMRQRLGEPDKYIVHDILRVLASSEQPIGEPEKLACVGVV